MTSVASLDALPPVGTARTLADPSAGVPEAGLLADIFPVTEPIMEVSTATSVEVANRCFAFGTFFNACTSTGVTTGTLTSAATASADAVTGALFGTGLWLGLSGGRAASAVFGNTTTAEVLAGTVVDLADAAWLVGTTTLGAATFGWLPVAGAAD